MLFEREVQAPKYPTCLKSMQIPGRKHREQFQKYQTRKKAAPQQQHRFSVRIQGIFYLLQDCYPMLSIHICSSKLKQFGIQNAHQQHTPSIQNHQNQEYSMHDISVRYRRGARLAQWSQYWFLLSTSLCLRFFIGWTWLNQETQQTQ